VHAPFLDGMRGRTGLTRRPPGSGILDVVPSRGKKRWKEKLPVGECTGQPQTGGGGVQHNGGGVSGVESPPLN